MDRRPAADKHLPMAKKVRQAPKILAKRPVWQRMFLTEWLEFTKKTQRQAAEATEISESHLSLIANGKRQYTQENLEKLAKFLGIEPGELLYPPDQSPLGRVILEMTPEERATAARVLAAMRK